MPLNGGGGGSGRVWVEQVGQDACRLGIHITFATSPFMPPFMSGLAGHKKKRKKLYVDKKLNRLAVPPIPLFQPLFLPRCLLPFVLPVVFGDHRP